MTKQLETGGFIMPEVKKKLLPEGIDRKTRTEFLNQAMRSVVPSICVERAKIVTESYKRTEGKPFVMRRAIALKDLLEQMHYGEMPMQIGTCAGFGDSIGALEYHKGDETVIAVTDCVILIGCQSDIVDGKFDTKDAEAFYVPAG